jgi:hypothetical protein
VSVLAGEMGPYTADIGSGIEAAFITLPPVPLTQGVLPTIRALVLLSVHHVVAAPLALLGFVTRLDWNTGLLPPCSATNYKGNNQASKEIAGLANLLNRTFAGSNDVDDAAAMREQRAAAATGALLLMVRLVDEVMAPRIALGLDPSGAASAETRAKVVEVVRVAVEWGAGGAIEEERQRFVRLFVGKGRFSNAMDREDCASHLLSFVSVDEAALARSASAPPTLPDVLLALAARDQ